jgi:hypothetical protein
MVEQYERDAITTHLLRRITEAPIEQDPFPHSVVHDCFPPDYYDDLLAKMPARSSYTPAEYPGTGMFTARLGGNLTKDQTENHHGYFFRDPEKIPVLSNVIHFLRHEDFSRALLQKFSAPGSRGTGAAIPADKHVAFSNGRKDFHCQFGLYKDSAGFEISPHPDIADKIVTFLFYLYPREAVTTCGTLLCRAKPGVDVSRLKTDYGESARKEGRAGLWSGWEKFEGVKEVGQPNTLLVFAPNEISFHAVRMSQATFDRTVLRGFIARKNFEDTWEIEQRSPTA